MCNIINYYLLICIVTYTGGVGSTILNYDNLYSNRNNSKISGGNDATIENYPHTALLETNDGSKISYCGGSIVSKTSIVTAASCLDGVKRVKVRIGSAYSDRGASIFSGGSEYLTTSISTHPQYNNNTGDFDVGIVKVDDGMQLDGERASIIRLPGTSSDATNGEVLTITGWGSPEDDDGTKPKLVLQVGKVSVITRKDCRLKIRGISARMFCAEGGANICKVDYGGPAMGEGRVLTGIASFSKNCSEPNMPGVYTRVGQALIRAYIRLETGV